MAVTIGHSRYPRSFGRNAATNTGLFRWIAAFVGLASNDILFCPTG
jgi:hypothetical protein